MTTPVPSPLEAAQHRAALLEAALAAAAAAAPARLPAPLALLAEGKDAEALAALETNGFAEAALDWARAHRRDDAALRAALDPLAAREKQRRAGRLQLDADRLLARARYTKAGAALPFGSPELQRLFAEVLRLEGLPLELDLGKRPRPLIACAPPLPPGAGSEGEWLEVQLRRSAGEAEELLPRLNARLPEGLRLLDWTELPVFATPVADLARTAHWRWTSDQADAPEKVAAFLASEAFFLEKAGKVEGQKAEKRVDLRPVVLAMAWEGPDLAFTTALGPTAGLNPLKLLGAILGREPESLTSLRRVGFDLAEDPRLAQADRYTTKLKNMYEDAVLLGAGSNITLVDDDEDEPLSLG